MKIQFKTFIGIIIGLVLLAGLSVSVATNIGQGKQIKILTEQNEQLAKTNDKQLLLIDKLGSLEGVNATVNFNISNKAILGNIKTGDFQPFVDNTMTYLRKELVENDTLIVSKRLVDYKSN